MEMGETLSVRALLLGERLETRGLERDDTLATNPFTLRVGRRGTAFWWATLAARHLPDFGVGEQGEGISASRSWRSLSP